MGRKNFRVSRNRTRPLESSSFWATSRIRKVRDFYEVLESVAWIWRLLGIFPLIVQHRMGKKTYESSKLYFVYNISFFAAVIGVMIYTIVVEDYRDNTFVSNSAIFIKASASWLLMSFSNLWRIIVIKEFSEPLNDLSEQYDIMEKMSCPSNYNSSMKMIRIYVWTMFFAVNCNVAWNSLLSYMVSGRILATWFVWMIPVVSQTMDLTILGSLVGWLGYRFHSLNAKLSDVVTRANASSPKVVVTSNVCAESLRILSKAHYNMCEIGRRINRAFNFCLIVMVTTAFLTVSSTLYIIFYEVRREGETNYVLIVWYASVVSSFGIPIIVIVIICNWTSDQAMETGKLIHEIRVENADSLLYGAVKSFSLQLHHQKLEFTAAGFFPLNSSLLQTMAGSITTHLVILIQFEPKI